MGEQEINSPNMRRSKLNLETIYKTTRAAIKEKPFITRGRPGTYSDILILTLLLYQTLKNLSYRETLEEAFTTFGKVPSLSTYHYRASKLPRELLKNLSARKKTEPYFSSPMEQDLATMTFTL